MMTEIIKKRRRKMGITQKEFADRLDISSKTVSRWESGVQMPDVILVPEIARVLGITVNELYGIVDGVSADAQPAVEMPEEEKQASRRSRERPVNHRAIRVYRLLAIIGMVISTLGGIWLCVYNASFMSMHISDIPVRLIGYAMFLGGMLVLLGNQVWFTIFRCRTDKERFEYAAATIQYGGSAFLLIFAMTGVLMTFWIGIPFTELSAAVVILAATAVQGGLCSAFRLPQREGVIIKRWIPITAGLITLITAVSYAVWMLHGAMTAVWAESDGTLAYYSSDPLQIVANIADMTHRLNYRAFLTAAWVLLAALIVVYGYLMRKIKEVNGD